jgi:TRAP-type C4-dicarboxylate transport system permease small subunit
MLDRLIKWLELPIHLFLWLCLAVGVLMMLHVSVDVAGRAFYRSFVGTNEIVSGYYMILLVYLPWAYIARNNGHIVADIFTRMIPDRVMFWIEANIKLLTLAYLGVFSWQTCLRAIQQTRAGEAMQVAGGYLQIWPSRWALPVGGALMFLYLVLRLSADIVNHFKAPR